ncbi:hypothetical protein SADUNF_Sadunf03G0013600 [Salix dunnii]|uniref:Nucleosome assembly protein 1 n=1 Tax=Salix dunnii TaxID=1413687 RepID=A0A835KFR2_9ROSI|nr:hypothetical protein SADUNF_Sadunf03G0013600 [Salix dunnii]
MKRWFRFHPGSDPLLLVKFESNLRWHPLNRNREIHVSVRQETHHFPVSSPLHLFFPLFVGHSAQRFEIVNGLEEVEGDKSTELAGIKEDRATKGALKFINDIKWSRLQNPEGFKLEFNFNPNPYFKNSVLTKTYHVIDDFDPILSQSIGTEIEWYPGKCLTKKVTLKKKPRMGSKIAKTITTNKNCESFFSFFTPAMIPENEDDRDDDAAYVELLDRIEQDYFVGVIIRDKTIPHAGSWFTGVVTKDDDAEKGEERKEGVKKDDNKDHAEEKERALKMEAEEKKKKKQRFEIVNGLEEVEGDKSTELAGIKEDRATKDEGALKFINDIKWSRLQNPEGFKLEFNFNPNPYFKNSVLTKTYHVNDEFDSILSQSIGTEIEWYPGKCLTKKVTLKKKPRMGSKIAKTITTNKNCESFFTFFTPPRIPENEVERDDDATYDELQDRMEQDYIVGVIIRDKIIPHAGSLFTGVATKDDEAEKEEERKEGMKKGDNKDHDEEKERALKKEVEEKRKKKQVKVININQ